jgi:uncharacterized integral membrane protein
MIIQAIIVALLAFSTGLLFYAALLHDKNIELQEKLKLHEEKDGQTTGL